MILGRYLWRRLDSPGHDACEFATHPAGYRLAGMAVFREGRRVCQLQYEVLADPRFHTRVARVAGRVGGRDVRLNLRAGRHGTWRLDGAPQPALEGCIDLDLGFTPATNLLPIRRLALRVGQQALTSTVYVDIPLTRPSVISQHYRRLSRDTYAYESPSHGYRATLQVSARGAIERYPGVFQLEDAGS